MSQFSRCTGLAAVIASITVACHANELLSPGLTGAVVTVVDSGPALKAARSFLVPDTIVDLARSAHDIGHAADKQIVAEVRRQFIDLGWRDAAADLTPDPDVIVLVGASTRIQTGWFYTDWYSSWGYLPYFGPATATWGWGVPGTAVPYAFPAGTLLITMLDRRNFDTTTRRVTLLWGAAIDGVIGSAEGTLERATAGVDQAFDQSDYLRIQ
jgi:hypothetical protein